MQIAFFDLPFHDRTQSSAFFLELLTGASETHPFVERAGRYISVIDGRLFNPLDYDCIVIFQYSPILRHSELRSHPNVVLVPMLDHVLASGVKDWAALWSGRKVVNFSCALDRLVARTRERALYVKYFPAPATVRTSPASGRVFFWERREVINCDLVGRLFTEHPVSSITIHRPPDPDNFNSSPEILSRHGLAIHHTEWFASRQFYLQELSNHQIFVASRPYEGIGMAFLEAMSLGLCVIAPDLPTHNEYIQHQDNGLLYDIKSPQLEHCDFARLGQAARQTCVEGHTRWLETIPRLLDFMLS